jgi:hypothetical protein
MEDNCQIHRYARLIRTNRKCQAVLGSGISSRLAAAIGNVALHVSSKSLRSPRGIEIGVHTDRFGDEFTELDLRFAASSGIRGRRWAVDLNWRFREDPLNRYTAIVARLKGELVGFAVFKVEDKDACVIDISGSIHAAPLLLEGVLSEVRERGVETLQAFISESNPLSAALRETGFWLRPSQTRVVAYAQPSDDRLLSTLKNRRGWSLTHADILG